MYRQHSSWAIRSSKYKSCENYDNYRLADKWAISSLKCQSYTIKVGTMQNCLKSNSVLTRTHESANIDHRINLFGLGWFRILSNHCHYKPTLIKYQHYYLKTQCLIKDVARLDNVERGNSNLCQEMNEAKFGEKS